MPRQIFRNNLVMKVVDMLLCSFYFSLSAVALAKADYVLSINTTIWLLLRRMLTFLSASRHLSPGTLVLQQFYSTLSEPQSHSDTEIHCVPLCTSCLRGIIFSPIQPSDKLPYQFHILHPGTGFKLTVDVYCKQCFGNGLLCKKF